MAYHRGESMPIRFDQGERPQTFEVIQFKLGRPHFLIAGSDVAFHRRHLLHWLNDQKRGIPCTHEECPWCPGPTREAWYLPCLYAAPDRRTWKQGVLTLTEKMHDFRKLPLAGAIWHFERYGRFNAPVTWKHSEQVFKPIPFAGFDVIPSLVRVWGMYANMKRRLEVIDGAEPRLFNEPGIAG